MLQLAIDAARTAGQYLKENVGHIRSVEHKFGQDTNLVTEMDKGSEALIIDMIRKTYPKHGILGEESGGSAADAETVWIIDPLDGTTNFTHGLPLFCVSIGVQHKGELVAGAVYDPNLNEMFTAEKGGGAYLNGQKLKVSSAESLRQSLLVTGFPYNIRDNPYNAVQHFTAFLMEAQAVRRLGSAALDLCYVGAGRFDAFWEVALQAWDMAAGILIVSEAGGVVTDFRGNEMKVSGRDLLASNGKIHQAMMDVLRRNL